MPAIDLVNLSAPRREQGPAHGCGHGARSGPRGAGPPRFRPSVRSQPVTRNLIPFDETGSDGSARRRSKVLTNYSTNYSSQTGRGLGPLKAAKRTTEDHQA